MKWLWKNWPIFEVHTWKGLNTKPTMRLDIDCYVNADFAALWPFMISKILVVSKVTLDLLFAFQTVLWLDKQITNRNCNLYYGKQNWRLYTWPWKMPYQWNSYWRQWHWMWEFLPKTLQLSGKLFGMTMWDPNTC